MFIDREDAANQLANALMKFAGKNVIVLGIPRGGAVTGFFIARALKARFSIIISRKIGHPANPEYAAGAIAEDGSIYLNPDLSGNLNNVEINRAIEIQKKEITRRVALLRHNDPLPNLTGETVIIADDGIATGATMFAAIDLCSKKGAARIIVAAAVASPRTYKQLSGLVDEVVIPIVEENFFAVSQVYREFPQVSDGEVIALMKLTAKLKSP